MNITMVNLALQTRYIKNISNISIYLFVISVIKLF
jgi:hypothetical protein